MTDQAIVKLNDELQAQIDLTQAEETLAIQQGESLQVWYLRKLAECDMAEQLVKDQAKLMLAQAAARRKTLAYLFGDEFKALVDVDLEAQPGNNKSVKYVTGKSGYRKTRGTLTIAVADAQEAIKWAVANGCVKLDETAMKAHYKDTGEVPDGIEVIETEPENNFYPNPQRLELTDG